MAQNQSNYTTPTFMNIELCNKINYDVATRFARQQRSRDSLYCSQTESKRHCIDFTRERSEPMKFSEVEERRLVNAEQSLTSEASPVA